MLVCGKKLSFIFFILRSVSEAKNPDCGDSLGLAGFAPRCLNRKKGKGLAPPYM